MINVWWSPRVNKKHRYSFCNIDVLLWKEWVFCAEIFDKVNALFNSICIYGRTDDYKACRLEDKKFLISLLKLSHKFLHIENLDKKIEIYSNGIIMLKSNLSSANLDPLPCISSWKQEFLQSDSIENKNYLLFDKFVEIALYFLTLTKA